ncbi:MAG TPA: glycerol-3-phosphate dehydrogenase/oxidase [Chitinophagaceae bacterium]|nr:glycerol-3-phosphate dehydrogenase/oxidase [Chitinophagaceae bacterium]
MNRQHNIERLKTDPLWDLLIIGGGATGLGIAVDAATRGYAVALVEKDDFAKGTSSRSTKLVHGGVRYLAQGNIKLVREALKERGILLKNAPHLTRRQSFIVPVFSWWEKFFYGIGLGLYDLMAGRLQIGKVRMLSRKAVLRQMPYMREKGLKGGVEYFDGQFDDARLAINLAQTAEEYGACLVNYIEVEEITKENKKVKGAQVYDHQSGQAFNIRAKAVINATGVFADAVIGMDNAEAQPMVTPSQGIHLVIDQKFFPGQSALMIPKTDDDRVLFAVPWHDKVVVGTTDTPVDEVRDEPLPLDEEINFIISHFNRYTSSSITRADVLSVFAGLRPLVKATGSTTTALISRDHTIVVSTSGLITIIGGKWTTYRKMAMDAVQNAVFVGKLEKRPCVTEDLRIHGWIGEVNETDHLHIYGSDAAAIRAMMEKEPQLKEKLHPAYQFCAGEVVWAVRKEMAVTVEDVLARRVRLLFLDAGAALEIAPAVASIMAREMGRDQEWIDAQLKSFQELAAIYLMKGA